MLVVFYPEKIALGERDRLIDLVKGEIFEAQSDCKSKENLVIIIGQISSLELVKMKFFPLTTAVQIEHYEEIVSKAIQNAGFNHHPVYVYGEPGDSKT